MIANSVHRQAFAVQMESIVFGEFKGAEAERIGHRINSLPPSDTLVTALIQLRIIEWTRV